MKIEEIRQLSLAYAQGEMTAHRRKKAPVDERWIRAYEDAWFVSGYQGRCTFELDGIVVTVREPRQKKA